MANKKDLAAAFGNITGTNPGNTAIKIQETAKQPIKRETMDKTTFSNQTALKTANMDSVEEKKEINNETSIFSIKAPKKPETRSQRKQFMITPSQNNKLKKYSKKHGVSENEIICQLIDQLS